MRTLNEPRHIVQSLNAAVEAQLVHGDTIDLMHSAGLSVHTAITKTSGTLSGDVYVSKSNDGTNWVTLTPVEITDVNGQTLAIEIIDAMYRYARVSISLETGAASFVVALTTKGF